MPHFFENPDAAWGPMLGLVEKAAQNPHGLLTLPTCRTMQEALKIWFREHSLGTQHDCAEFCAICLFPCKGYSWCAYEARRQHVQPEKHFPRSPVQLNLPNRVLLPRITVQELITQRHEESLCMQATATTTNPLHPSGEEHTGGGEVLWCHPL